MRLKPRQTLRPVAGTLGSRLVGLAIGVPVSILVARALGPGGKGVFAAAITVAGIGVQVGSLGLPSANTYFASRARPLLTTLYSNSLVFGTLLGLLVSLALGTLHWVGGLLSDFGDTVFVLALLLIPVGIGRLLQQSLLAGVQDFTTVNLVEIGAQATTLVVFLILWASGVTEPVGYVAGSLALAAAAWVTLTMAARRYAFGNQGPSLRLLLEQIPYGLKAYLVTLFGYLLLRSDIILVQSISGDIETGLYSVAVSLADLLYVIPAAVGMVLFPQLAELTDPDERSRLTRTVVLHTSWVLALLVGLALLAAQPAIVLLFGSDFSSAYPMFLILGPAIFLYGLNTLLSIHLAARGFPPFAVVVWGSAFALNLALNLALIPSAGAEGAATASLISYAAVLAAHLVYMALAERRQAS